MSDRASPVLIYERGGAYVANLRRGRTAHGLVGRLTVAGQVFDTVERMDGRPALAADRTYPRAALYIHVALGPVVNPAADPGDGPPGRHVPLLRAAGAVEEIEAGLAPGTLGSDGRLLGSDEAMQRIFALCGGEPDLRRPVPVVFRVTGAMPRLVADCRPYAAAGRAPRMCAIA